MSHREKRSLSWYRERIARMDGRRKIPASYRHFFIWESEADKPIAQKVIRHYDMKYHSFHKGYYVVVPEIVAKELFRFCTIRNKVRSSIQNLPGLGGSLIGQTLSKDEYLQEIRKAEEITK